MFIRCFDEGSVKAVVYSSDSSLSFLLRLLRFSVSSLVRDELIRAVVMDGDAHSASLCSRALISMLIASLANNRASLFGDCGAMSFSTHLVSAFLLWRSAVVLGRSDESSVLSVVVVSQTVWLRAGRIVAPHVSRRYVAARTTLCQGYTILQKKKGKKKEV